MLKAIIQILTKLITKFLNNTKKENTEYKKENTKMNRQVEEKDNINEFLNRMCDWGEFYPKLTGCRRLYLEDGELENNDYILPGAGDWVVEDIRGCGDTYGISHETWEILETNVRTKENTSFRYQGSRKLKDINFDIFKDYKDEDFKILIKNFKIIMETNLFEDIEADFEDETNPFTLAFNESISSIEKFIRKCSNAFKSGVKDEVKEMFTVYFAIIGHTKERFFEMGNIVTVMANIISDQILKNYKTKEELEEALKILSNAEYYFYRTNPFFDNELITPAVQKDIQLLEYYLQNSYNEEDIEELEMRLQEFEPILKVAEGMNVVYGSFKEMIEYMRMNIFFKLSKKDDAFRCATRHFINAAKFDDTPFTSFFENSIVQEEYDKWYEESLYSPNNYNYYKKDEVSTKTLIYRYYWIVELFMDWESETTPNIYACWNNDEEINSDYEKEKKTFKNDPYLALYWLLHFGFTLDKRFEEVKQIVQEYKLALKLEFIDTAINFFEETDENFTFEIKGDYDLFLKRRAYLISTAKASEDDNFESWWKSVTIYPEYEKYSLRRVKTLKDKIEKYDKWNEFDNIPDNEKENINLVSYIYACNPSTQNKEKYSDIFLQELKENMDILIDYDIYFAQTMIWDIRNNVNNKNLLKEVTESYFKNDTLDNEYKDIKEALGEEIPNFEECVEVLEKLYSFAEPLDNSESLEEKSILFEKIDSIFSETEPKIIYQITTNLKHEEIAKRCFHYIFTHDLPEKKDVLINLYSLLNLSKSDLTKDVFIDEYLNIIKDLNDPNVEIAMELVKNKYNGYAGWSKEAAMSFLENIAHLPKIFDFFIEIFTNPKYDDEYTKYHIVNEIFRKVEKKLSKEQLETLLNSYVNFLVENANSDYKNNFSQTIMQIRTHLSFIQNSSAIEWLHERYCNDEWLSQFEDIKIFIDDEESMAEKFNEYFESSLENSGNQFKEVQRLIQEGNALMSNPDNYLEAIVIYDKALEFYKTGEVTDEYCLIYLHYSKMLMYSRYQYTFSDSLDKEEIEKYKKAAYTEASTQLSILSSHISARSIAHFTPQGVFTKNQ